MLSLEFKISNQRSADIHTNSGRLYWERADEIFICRVKIRHKMVSLQKPLKLGQFLLFQKRSKLLESEKSSPMTGAFGFVRLTDFLPVCIRLIALRLELDYDYAQK